MVNAARSVNVRDLGGFACADDAVGVYFPAQAEVARGLPGNALLQRAASAFAPLAARVFRAQGAGFRVGKQGQVAKAVGYAVKSHEIRLLSKFRGYAPAVFPIRMIPHPAAAVNKQRFMKNSLLKFAKYRSCALAKAAGF